MKNVLNNAPCYGCQEHSEKCHGSCKKYKEWVDLNEERKKAIKKETGYKDTIFSPGYISTIAKKNKKILQGRRYY